VTFTIGTRDGLPDTHRALLFASLNLLSLRRANGLLNAWLSMQMPSPTAKFLAARISHLSSAH
jgi:hypothetical protein